MRCLMICLFFPLVSFAQRDTIHTNAIVKLNLMSPVDFVTFPTMQVSVEKKIYKNISLSAEVGYQLYPSYYSNEQAKDTAFIKTRGLKASLEWRVYLKKRKRELQNGLYVGGRLFYWQNKYNERLLYSLDSNAAVYTDCIWVRKKNWGMMAVAGYQKNVGRRLLFDFSIGIGSMNRTAIDYNREYNPATHKLNQPIDLTVVGMRQLSSLSENNGSVATFNLCIRVGFRL